MRNIILSIFILFTVTCQAQVNGNFKSVRVMNSDSTHGTIDGTIYRGSDGFLRFMYNNVHYRFATASESTTASNGLTEVGNDVRLGGTLSSTTAVNGGGFDLTLGASANKLNKLDVFAGATITLDSDDDVNINANGDDINMIAVDRIALNGTEIALSAGSLVASTSLGTNNSLTRVIVQNQTTGNLHYRDASTLGGTIGGTIAATQVGYGSGVNTLKSEAGFEYNETSNVLIVPIVSTSNIQSSGNLTLTPSLDLALSGTDITVSAASDVTLSGNDNLIMSFQDAATLSTASSDITIAGGNDVVLQSNGNVTRLIIDSDGSFTVNGSDGTSGQALVSNGSGSSPTWQTVTSTPGGANTQVQFNNSGAFGGDADFTFTGGNLVTATNVTVSTNLINSALTSGRVPVIGTSGLFTDDADFTFSSNVLNIGSTLASNPLQLSVDGISGTGSTNVFSLTGNPGTTGTSITITAGSSTGAGDAGSVIITTGQDTSTGSEGVFSIVDPDAVFVLRTTTSSGISNISNAIKHQRVTTGSISAGATALVTLTWSTAFTDSNYTVSASVVDATTSSLSLSVVHVESISASSVTVRVLNNAVGSLTGTLHCIAIHD